MFTELTKFLDSFLEMGVPGYDCIVKHHGETVYRHWNGYANRETKAPMTGKEHVFIYSCSKVITVTAALQQYEKGRFQLDDKLADYIPEYSHMMVRTKDGLVPAKGPMTIRQLFTMTAGLDYNLASPSLKKAREATGGLCPTLETIRYLAQEPLCYEPGAIWQYSLAHDVLAALVEVWSGQEFNSYVTEHIFRPSGMTESTFLPTDEQLKTVAQLYRGGGEGAPVEVIPTVNGYQLGRGYASGGAGCLSTLEDYILFLEGLRTFKLLKPETIALMTTDQLTDAQRKTYWNTELGYGLGVRCKLPRGAKRADFGWGGAAGAWLSIDQENDYTAFYIQHVLNSPNSALRNNLHHVIVRCLA